MHFGVLLPPFRRWCNREAVREIAKAAEGLGFSSIWATDHLVAPLGPLDRTAVIGSRSEWMRDTSIEPVEPHRATAEQFYGRENWYLEPYTLMAFLAGITDRIKIGSALIVIPYRNPIVQARMVATLDELSNGRILLGVGSGHVQSESEALGVAYAERGKITDEYLKLMIQMWTNDKAGFHGDYFQFNDVLTLGRPVQKPHPPLFAGGMARAAIRRAVRFCQGWIPTVSTPSDLARGLAYARDFSSQVGRTKPFEVIPGLGGYHIRLDEPEQPGDWVGEVYDQRTRLKTTREMIEDIQGYRSMDIKHFHVTFYPGSLRIFLRQLERFAREVMPEVEP